MSEELYVLGTKQHSYQQGDTVSLTVDIGEPNVGDSVYFLAVKKPIGIVAKAEVLKSLENGVVQFLIHECREQKELIPEFVLQNQFPNVKWPTLGGYQPFESIIQFSSLDALWESSSGQHLVSQIIRLFKSNKSPNSWYQEYVDFVDWFKSKKSNLADEDIIKLWAGSDSISSIAPKRINREQCIQNMSPLRSIVEKIIQSPTKETHEEVKVQWKTDTNFPSVLHVAINRIYAANEPQRFTSIVSESKYFKRLYVELAPLLGVTDKYSNWVDSNIVLKQALTPLLDSDDIEVNTLLWELARYLQEGNVTQIQFIDNKSDASGIDEPESDYSEYNMSVPLNQVLYGPPGTGKTYHTIEAAVKAAEPKEYASFGIDSKLGATKEQRQQLIKKYKTLSNSGRIRFVTFHQSYGYEEFVEGLSAKTERGQISYYEKDGIFKEICLDAQVKPTNNLAKFERALEDLKKAVDGQFVSLETSTGKKFDFTYHGRTTFRIYPEESKHEDLGNGYPTSIKHLTNFYLTGDESDIYNRSYVRAILNYMKENYGISDYDPEEDLSEPPNYVLVIDEINRGNISKIFGELITLIEPSKRKGAGEEIELILPCSGDKFSVPNNLYIISTMNTADRSLAMMDTALRRRFDFVEMMPKPELFNLHLVEYQEHQIDLKRLLEELNKRIEVLYDREHTLGHAFLFPAYNAAKAGKHELAFTKLKEAFKNKIIPLLEEYFHEDWNKIRLVLGDSFKKEKNSQLLEMKKETYSELFGVDHGLELYEDDKTTYQIKPFDCKDSIWDKAEAYIGIYSSEAVNE